jgi:hypothetical protein
MATTRPQKTLSYENGWLKIENRSAKNTEAAIQLTGKIVAPLPGKEKEAIIIGCDARDENGQIFYFKDCAGSDNVKFASVDAFIDFIITLGAPK